MRENPLKVIPAQLNVMPDQLLQATRRSGSANSLKPVARIGAKSGLNTRQRQYNAISNYLTKATKSSDQLMSAAQMPVGVRRTLGVHASENTAIAGISEQNLSEESRSRLTARGTSWPAVQAQFLAGNISLWSILSLLPFNIAQKILNEREAAIVEFFKSWSESLKLNAKLDKEASERAQKQCAEQLKRALKFGEAVRRRIETATVAAFGRYVASKPDMYDVASSLNTDPRGDSASVYGGPLTVEGRYSKPSPPLPGEQVGIQLRYPVLAY